MSTSQNDTVRTAMKRLNRYDLPQEQLDALTHYLSTSDDRELYKANPRYIATKLDVDTHTALRIMAYAVQEGVFDLHWDVHCPMCGKRARTFSTLSEGRGVEFCPNCAADFDPYLDHDVRVTFTVNQAVRQIAAQEPLSTEFSPTPGLALLNVQPFRDLFGDNVLPHGESLKVQRVAFLFTDLLGSTAMYAREGDPQAYDRVREHFEVLFHAADQNHGVTVKTIGDAVMASFVAPDDALQTAVDIHRDMAALNRQLGLSGDESLAVRLGTHVGPCISVTLNDQLDYFGATVNIASRVSHLSQGDDVVLTDEVLTDSEVQSIAAQHGELEPFGAKLRGYEQNFQLQRLMFAA